MFYVDIFIILSLTWGSIYDGLAYEVGRVKPNWDAAAAEATFMLSCDDLTGRGGGGGGGEGEGGSGWVYNGIAEVFVLIGPHWLLKTGGIPTFGS